MILETSDIPFDEMEPEGEEVEIVQIIVSYHHSGPRRYDITPAMYNQLILQASEGDGAYVLVDEENNGLLILFTEGVESITLV